MKKAQIVQNSVVSISYRLTDDRGELIESTEGSAPLSYLHGHGQIIPGLERALEGKEVGESSHITVSPADGYGEHSELQVFSVPRRRFGFEVFPGQVLQAQLADGRTVLLRVIMVSDEAVTLDGNHPLAGKTLEFDVTVIDVRPASEDELRRCCGR